MKRRATALAGVLFLASVAAAAQTVDLRGFLAARGLNVSGPPSWVRGGFGRFDAGGQGQKNFGIAEAQLGIDWRPWQHLVFHAHGVARSQRGSTGLVSAYAEMTFGRGRNEIELRGGQFFLGTSRENTNDLWTSPYTISLSALNSWIAQEVRPVGVNAEWRVLTSTAVITTSTTLFGENDTMGALLAWRGWTVGNRLAVYDEVIRLPPLSSLRDVFVHQRSDGTIPFERDLDGRIGFAGRARFAIPERFNMQYTHLDNRGDRRLHRGEYAWKTRFDTIGAEAHAGSTTLLAEWMSGRTGMGAVLPARIDIRYYAAYALASHKVNRSRFSARLDFFSTRGQYDERGHAITATWLFDVTSKIRTGAELTRVVGTHEQAEEAGVGTRIDGNSAVVELRYSLR